MLNSEFHPARLPRLDGLTEVRKNVGVSGRRSVSLWLHIIRRALTFLGGHLFVKLLITGRPPANDGVAVDKRNDEGRSHAFQQALAESVKVCGVAGFEFGAAQAFSSIFCLGRLHGSGEGTFDELRITGGWKPPLQP